MRKQNWPELLDKYIRESGRREYEYQHFNCVTFGAAWVIISTGINMLKGIKYKDKNEALSILENSGGLFKMTEDRMADAGFKTVNPALAKRGDVVGFFTKTHGETVGICVGKQFASPGLHELVFLPMRDAVKAWEII